MLRCVLEAPRHNIVLVAGEDKAEPLQAVVREPFDPYKYPAQIGTHDTQNVMWFLHRAAARLPD